MGQISAEGLVSGAINGVSLSCIYILISLGLALVLSIMNIMQFAHGELYMLGAFGTYCCSSMLGINVFVSILISMIAVGVLGLILERLLFRPLLGKFLPVVCATLGLMLVLQTSVRIAFGSEQKFIPSIWPGVFRIGWATVPHDRFLAVVTCICFTGVVFAFLKRSKYGQAIVATAQDAEGALMQGINPKLMYALVMVIGSALAAVAGGFGGAIFVLSPFMGGTALMKGMFIVVLGGTGSLLGVIVGGALLGFSDALVPIAFGSAASVIAPLVLIIIVLIVRPQGLFGHE
jgi:branched-chain amino acid transport system permease protein